MQHETIELDAFLEGLPEEAAANARAAAARIDDLEHAAQRIGRSDRQYVVLFVIAGVFAVIAAVMALGSYRMFGGGYARLGDLIVLVMASAFPVLVLIYSLRMRERTRLDRKKFELIETNFLPYNAIYLPRGPDRARGVIAVRPKAKAWRKPNLKNVKNPGWYW